MVGGGLWLCLWVTRLRLLGLVPLGLGAIGASLSTTPDLLVSGEGRHLAVVRDGVPLLLRERAGDYVRDLFAEASGFDGDPQDIASGKDSSCSPDSCLARLRRGDKEWRLLAIRSATRIEWAALIRACAEADIVVAERRLPRGRTALAEAGPLGPGADRRCGSVSRPATGGRHGCRSRRSASLDDDSP
ncbi:MAG: hypothetical protein AVDCRST_MAG44-4 [uncultured Sphingomonas sp.]|uniref:Uncharacterized protein n=1 Tax=uncultured Sphingomonas sp. TaxID=158754 RepID=A0A6J4S0T7_9SPHN|nr:MAG: hypothetical protein AVDCRST_MAG44-4 [uncultured Sphingomonas sp.]